MRNEPEEDGERDANYEASHNGKVERGVFAAVNDVAGQFSQAKGQLVPEIKKKTNQDEESSEEQKRATEFAKRVHKIILPEPPDKSGDSFAVTTHYRPLTSNAS